MDPPRRELAPEQGKTRDGRWDRVEELPSRERILPPSAGKGQGGIPSRWCSKPAFPKAEDAKRGRLEGRVLEFHSEWCVVQIGPETLRCRPRGKMRTLGPLYKLAVGDFVRVETGASGEGRILEILPRRNEIARRSLGRHRSAQVIAVNVDQMVIVGSAASPPWWPGLIDRYLVAAAGSSLSPVICINKIDLDASGESVRHTEEYQALGYHVLRLSALTREGLESMRERLKGTTSVLVGQSGVGKSSLLNSLEPGLDLRTGEISGATERGRHVTSGARLLALSGGGFVADTPGVRSFVPFQIGPNDVLAGYPEIARAAAGCRFPDCRHAQEPGCAVLEAVHDGEILTRRYRSFRSILTGGIE
ncbi:MAG: ribosome small subunit-dependent GTPase A [Planctomycetes bacterium]|nr:ribosome small subunit-dependent GTPase A [Planctomycetota bacterium]